METEHTERPMTVETLRSYLDPLPADLPVAFTTAEGTPLVATECWRDRIDNCYRIELVEIEKEK